MQDVITECLLKQVFSSSTRELRRPWKAGIFNSTQWSSLKLASAILIEAHVFKSLSQNHAWEIRSQILYALSTRKITKSTENTICPWLTPSVLLLGPIGIWYGTMRNYLFSHMAFCCFFFLILLVTFVGVLGCLGEDFHSEPQILPKHSQQL